MVFRGFGWVCFICYDWLLFWVVLFLWVLFCLDWWVFWGLVDCAFSLMFLCGLVGCVDRWLLWLSCVLILVSCVFIGYYGVFDGCLFGYLVFTCFLLF